MKSAVAALLLSLAAAPLCAAEREPLLLTPSWAPPALFLKARPALLDAAAFDTLPPCALDPFADPNVGEQAYRIDHRCGQDRLSVRIDTPVRNPVDSGPSGYAFEVDQLMTQDLGSDLTASVRAGWSGSGNEQIDRVLTGRAMVAAGAQLRPDPDLALAVNVGRDAGPAMRSRTTMSGAWRPLGDDNLLFVQAAAEAEGIANTVGVRWWLVPGKMSVDVSARRSPDGQTVDPHVGLSVLEFAR